MCFLSKTVIIEIIVISISCSAKAQQRYLPLRISEPITLDGKLDEPVWKLASPLTEFMQTDPSPGAVPTEKTEARMLYNDEYLFVGYHCFDSEPKKIIRLMMSRDFEVGKDDGVSVALDTYNNKSSGACFVTNTLNGRWDSEFTNNGNDENDDYNTYWDVTSVMDSSGYAVEFQIPFSSLRFEARDTVVMGFRLARLIKRKNELITYPRCDSSISNLWINFSQAAELEFTNLKSKKPIYITPYVIGNFDQQNILNSDSTGYDKSNTFFTRKHYVTNETLDKILSNIGCDIKYGIAKNFTLDVTVNTDFAQAEADNRIINLTKYAINLPEKRSFFLESQDYLNYNAGQSTQLFTSRTIGLEDDIVVPIIGGVRVTGKQNGWAVGALNMQTTDVKSENIVAQNFSAARFRKYYGDKGSFWGGIFTNRISTKNNLISNQSVAVDAVHHFNDKWFAGFGTAATYDTSVYNTFDKNTFINLYADKIVNEGYSHGFGLELAGQKFNPAMGFNPETGYGFVSLTNGKRTRVQGEHAINYWTLNSEIDYRWKLQSKLTETKFVNLQAELDWVKGSVIIITPVEYKEDRYFYDLPLNDHITVPAGYYHMYNVTADFLYDESKSFTFELIPRYGDYYGGKNFLLNPSVSYIINRYLSFQINYERNQIKFPQHFSDNGDDVYLSNLVSANFSVTFSSKVSVKLLAEYDDSSDSFGGNLRIRYNPREGTDLYIVYNSNLNTNRLEAKPALPVVDEQTIIIKYLITFGL